MNRKNDPEAAARNAAFNIASARARPEVAEKMRAKAEELMQLARASRMSDAYYMGEESKHIDSKTFALQALLAAAGQGPEGPVNAVSGLGATVGFVMLSQNEPLRYFNSFMSYVMRNMDEEMASCAAQAGNA